MRLTRIHLENYRVYEDPVDVEVPAGLVGVYGPNGAGKSYFVEAIPWTLFGRSRTNKDEIRTAGVSGDCLTEVEFEHEGHLYLIRRRIGGINATIRAEALADGFQVAEGSRDVGRYVHSIVGMDEAAFRASVFAEQKQLATFSASTPAERRRLVLGLLGITALDGAREQARKDARDAQSDYDRLRGALPDLEVLREERDRALVDFALAGEQAKARQEAAHHAGEARRLAELAHKDLDHLERSYDTLVTRGKATRQALAEAQARLSRLDEEHAELEAVQVELGRLADPHESEDFLGSRLGLIRAANEARRQLESLEPLAAAPTEPDVARAHAAQAVLDEARSELAGAQARVQAARQEWERLVAVAEKSELLSQEADCPVCGQELGQAFKQVKAHRHQEAESARARLEVETRAHHDAGNRASTASEAALWAAALLATEQKTWAEHAAGAQERESARERWIKACDAAGGEPGPDEELTLSDRLSEVRQVVQTRARLSGRLARLADMEEARRAEAKGVNDLDVSLTALRRQVREMDFKPDVLAGAKRALEEARDQVDLSANAWHQAEAEAASQQARAEVAGARLADAEKAAVRIDDLAGRARNLGRLAELMNSFRNAVVSAIGPRLSVQAADLFAELTDKEYDKLEVDPNSYDIRITDQGHTYGMERFSGSETDLANLALRVAISEHLRFQSGGSVGLLVLDEVFGPLDEDRKVRMLSALERLKARFQQVLVVTHDEVIKEQLPNAIEVIKLPGRRAGLQPA